MKRIALYIGMAAALVASCSVQEEDFKTPQMDDVVFYASFEQPAEGTRVYANESLYLRWNADDRVSIFNKNTYNQQYRFTGETGDNAGGFKKVDTDEFVTGNAMSNVVSVYPYQEGTKISEEEVLTLILPAEQHYAENTFGLGANTMVSVSEDNFLQYKNVGGYLRISLYGEGVTVSSITLKGNNGEKLAGKATVTMPLDGTPTVTLANDASDEITLVCDTPVELAATVEKSKSFWFVIPPSTFDKGFTVSVNQTTGGTFEKSTSKSISVERSKLSKMSPMEVEEVQPVKNIVFADDRVKAKLVAAFDTSGDGELSYEEAASVTSSASFKDAFGQEHNFTSFDEFQFFTGITIIPDAMFKDWTLMKSIVLPDSITSIGSNAFSNCAQLSSIDIPDGVLSIGSYAFGDCYKLEAINIPENVSTLSDGLFFHCGLLSTITIPQGVTSIGALSFAGCSGLKEINIPDGVTIIDHMAFEDCEGLTSITIPGSVKLINNSAFFSCGGLTSVVINEGVTTIGSGAFNYCTKLASISIPKSISNCTGDIFTECTSVSHLYVNSVEDWLGFLDKCGLYAYASPLEATTQAVHFYVAGSEITDLNLSTSFVRIPNRAFMNCAYISTVIIPKTVSSIGTNAFNRCFGLTSVKVFAEAAPRGGYGMFASTGNCPIYVPAQSVDDYKTAEVWSEYAARIYAWPPVPEAIDLGLPSGLKWASFNLGASKPEEYGDYYAWGETDPKNDYSWSTYKWCKGSSTTMTKYCSNSSYGYNGFTDKKTVLDAEDDAAHVNLGGNWRMPTDADWTELRTKCTWTWTTRNGVNGRLVTGSNGNSIFLPAAGYRYGTNLGDAGTCGGYWSSSLDVDRTYRAWSVYFDSGDVYRYNDNRYYGQSVRPVTE